MADIARSVGCDGETVVGVNCHTAGQAEMDRGFQNKMVAWLICKER